MSQIKIFNNIENEDNSYQKVTHLPSSILNDNMQGNLRKSERKYPKRVKIILPNLSKSNILINRDTNKDISYNLKNNKNEIKNINNKSIINYSSDRNTIKIQKRLHLNKSISFPSLKTPNLLKDKNINDYSSKRFLNFSTKNINNSSSAKNLFNINNQKNRQLIRSNLLSNKYIRLEKPNIFKDKLFDFKTHKNRDISKSCINYKNTKDITTSTFKISKIKLNESGFNTSKDRKNISNLSNKNTGSKTFFRHDSSIIGIPKHSHFFKIAQKDNVTAKRIYKHYLRKSKGEITRPIRNYKRFFDDRSQTFMEKLSRIYCENKNFLSIIKEIKDNNKIAFKPDFNIEEYQSTIIELMDDRVSQKYLLDLQNDYRALNKKLNGIVEPKGRFTILAEKLRYNLPLYLLEKMKQLDKQSILSRVRYYNKFKKFKQDKKLFTRFNDNSNSPNKINNFSKNNKEN